MNDDPISFPKYLNVAARQFNFSCDLMPKNRRGNVISVKFLDICAADSAGPHVDKNITGANCWSREIFDFNDSSASDKCCLQFCFNL